MEINDKTIGESIRDAREEAGLSQAEVGGIIHLSRQAVGDRERGRTGFRASEVVQLQGVLKVKLFD
jgi:transcriptional regulator with XRE-family HTH domain